MLPLMASVEVASEQPAELLESRQALPAQGPKPGGERPPGRPFVGGRPQVGELLIEQIGLGLAAVEGEELAEGLPPRAIQVGPAPERQPALGARPGCAESRGLALDRATGNRTGEVRRAAPQTVVRLGGVRSRQQPRPRFTGTCGPLPSRRAGGAGPPSVSLLLRLRHRLETRRQPPPRYPVRKTCCTACRTSAGVNGLPTVVARLVAALGLFPIDPGARRHG